MELAVDTLLALGQSDRQQDVRLQYSWRTDAAIESRGEHEGSKETTVIQLDFM